MVVLPSGLQYRSLRQGTGRRPGPGDKVKVHYRSTLLDGTEFHNSFRGEGEPELLHVSGVIRGMAEGLQLMRRAPDGSSSFPRTSPTVGAARWRIAPSSTRWS